MMSVIWLDQFKVVKARGVFVPPAAKYNGLILEGY